MVAIQTRHLHLSLGHFGLEDISVSIPRGKMTAIVGPNGSGKSTFLKVLSRLLKPDQGEAFLLDKPTAEYRTKEFAQTVAMLPQAKDSLPDFTVKELVAYGRSPYKRFLDQHMNEQDEQIINQAMDATGIQRYRDRMFHTLSGGEQQRARIAMALAQQTEILLLDEPTTYLDIAHQFDLMEMLRTINQQYKMTIVMVLHDLSQAVTYSHYLIAMKGGKVAQAGEPQTMLTSQFLRDVYEIEASVKFEQNYPLIIPIIHTHRGN
ncbi:ABC transporter ATP-binding protein [Brevibacillus sp. TJ4]|uniref:ABC transporter ATP-binding protein n=1 Tax=Brevibacillus sp. TJ4 TaxID=3234853 RepID=UPI003B9ECE38